MERTLMVGLALPFLILTVSESYSQILLREDFNDGVADGFAVESGDWEIVDGAYHVAVSGFQVYLVSAGGDVAWADYRLECDLKAVGSVNQTIRFRVQDPDDYYCVNVRADPWNDVVLEKAVGGARTRLARVPFSNQNAIWHHFLVDLTGPVIEFRCDGRFLIRYSDPHPYLQGGVALEGFSGGLVQWQDMYFDNVLVQVLVVAMTGASRGRITPAVR